MAASGEDPPVERKAKQLVERKRRALMTRGLVVDYATGCICTRWRSTCCARVTKRRG